jgi:acetyl-CoA synthetase
VRRLEFVAELPKTISGKIRRVQLRAKEATRQATQSAVPSEYREEDFPDLRQEN